jgi:hypothetical protein
VTTELALILQELGVYYRGLQEHLNTLEETLKTTRPSDDELRMVQQRWTDFLTSLGNLPNEVADALHLLDKAAPKAYRVDDPLTSVLPGITKSSTTQETGASPMQVPGLLLLEGTKIAGSRATKTFWHSFQAFFQLLMPCFRPNTHP